LPALQFTLARSAFADDDLFTARRAVSVAARAEKLGPGLLAKLAAMQRELGEIDAPLRLLTAGLERFPNSCAILNSLACYYFACSDSDNTLRCFRQAAKAAPTRRVRLNALLGAGDCLQSFGLRDAAIQQYREVIEIAPDDIRAYCHLASCLPDPDLANDLRSSIISLMPLADKDDTVTAHYALGMLADRAGRTGEAFAHFHLANERRSAIRGSFNVELLRNEVEARTTIYSSQRIAELGRYGSPDDGLVFIVGMPRSGTTLVEQILSSHSQVRGLGERGDIWRLVRSLRGELGSRKEYPWCADELTPAIIKRLSRSLADGLRRDADHCKCVATKRPEDFWDLGLIASLLPRARIIHCRRHPIDTCLSCYTQNFEWVPYSTSLERLCEVYRLYLQMIEHWRAVLPPSSIFEVCYEDLVQRPETVVPRLCAFCGVAFEEGCLRFHTTERRIHTASRWQVRRPLYQTSLRRWERYREFIGPLLPLENIATASAHPSDDPSSVVQAADVDPLLRGLTPDSINKEPSDGEVAVSRVVGQTCALKGHDQGG
jgi:Flp pilus assembly protein TadD